MRASIFLLVIALAFWKADSRKVKVQITHQVECTSQGIQSISSRTYVKRQSRLFQSTLDEKAASIQDALEESRANSSKEADRIMLSRSTDSISDSAGASAASASVSVSGSGFGFSAKASASASRSQSSRDFSQESQSVAAERETLQELSKSRAIASMMAQSLAETTKQTREDEQNHETEQEHTRVFQSGRFQQWRKYRKTVVIDGQVRVEEVFEYVHDSPDEITREESKDCAIDYMNDYILINSGLTTDRALIQQKMSFTVPDDVTCQVGHYLDRTGRCERCPAGQFQPNGGQNRCLQCKAGTYQNNPGSRSCKPCPYDQYQPYPGQDSCVNCPDGLIHTNFITGQTSLSSCKPPQYNEDLGLIRCRPGYNDCSRHPGVQCVHYSDYNDSISFSSCECKSSSGYTTIKQNNTIVCEKDTSIHSDVLGLNGKGIHKLSTRSFYQIPARYTQLSLVDNQLTTLPDGIFNGLDRLTILDLHGNQLTTLPDGIFNGLDNLTGLGLTTLPDGIFNGLDRLTYLGLWNNQLTTLPDGIFNGLDNLTGLYLDCNQLTTLPDGIFNGLDRLTHLGLTTLPDGIFNGLDRLTHLGLRYNQLTMLPDGIFNGLDSLTGLYLSDNQLTTLPDGIFNGLDNLTTLHLHRNQLTTLPDGIFSGLDRLTVLALRDNKLTTLPDGIFNGLDNLISLSIQQNDFVEMEKEKIREFCTQHPSWPNMTCYINAPVLPNDGIY